ncbi:MAG: MMPL family transporter [Gammaproteobacteria bacterium]
MIESYISWLSRWRYVVLIVVICGAGLAGSGMRLLTFDADYQVFFSKRNPQLQAFQEFQNIYSKSDNVLFVLAPDGGDVFTRKVLEAVERITEAAWQIPYSRRVDSITNYQHTSAVKDTVLVRDLVRNADQLTAPELRQIRKIALSEPLLVNRLISPSGHVTGINVTLQLMGKDLDEISRAVTYAHRLREEVQAADPGIRVYLTGGAVMDYSFPEATIHDIRTLVPVVFLVIVVLMVALLRSFTGTLATVSVMVLAATTGMGLAGWMGMRLTPPSVGAFTMIMTLAVADSIHILSTLFAKMRRGSDCKAGLIESLQLNFRPVLTTSLTTAVGFLSMNFSDAPPFQDLGNIVAMGIIAAFVYSMVVIPVLMTILPVRVPAYTGRQSLFMDRFAELVITHRSMLLWCMTGLVLLLAAFIPRIELNDQFVEYFDESVPFRMDTEFAMNNLTGIYLLEYALESGESNGIGDPAYLSRLDAFAKWFRAQPETVHVNTISDIFKRLNKNMHNDDPAWYRLPESRELAAQYLLLYEMSLPYGLGLSDQINLDKSASRFTVTARNLSTRQFRSLEERAAGWLRAHAPVGMFAKATGPAVMFAYISERNIRTMMVGTGLALVLITIILMVVLKSIKLGMISLLPNVIPVVMAFGVWGLVVGKVGLVISVILAMVLGVIVDDTVHFMSSYRRARHLENKNPEDAVRFAFSSVGAPLWITTVVLVAGFFVLSLSTFQLNATTGQLTAMTLTFALLADFLLLPTLLMRVKA